MRLVVDLTAWRAYSAEHSLPIQPRLSGSAQVQALVDEVISSPFWQELVGRPHHVKLIEAPFDAHESWLERDRGFSWTEATLAIHRDMRWSLNVLHELAHGVAPRYRYVTDENSGRDWPGHRELHPHGAMWVATYLQMVHRFAPDTYAELQEAYAHYGVPMVSDRELAEATRESQRAEAEFVAWAEAETDEQARAFGEMMISAQQDSSSRLLGRSLANVLTRSLLRSSQAELGLEAEVARMVERVAPVVACTAEDVLELMDTDTLLELQTGRTDEEGEWWGRLAASLLIVLDTDPIVMISDLGVLPPDPGEKDRQLNPSWWARFDELMTMAERRPSRWWPTVAGRNPPWAT